MRWKTLNLVRVLIDNGGLDDDQIQELFFKVKQIDVNHPMTSRSTEPPSESKVLDGKLFVLFTSMINL